MSCLLQFVNNVASAYKSRNAHAFELLFTLEPTATNIAMLQQELSTYPDDSAVEQIVDSILEDVSMSLAGFTTKYLHLVQNLQNADLMLVFDLFEGMYNALIPVFNSSDGAYLVPLVKNLSSELVNLALIVDKTLGLQGKSQKVNNAARLLSKMFNMMLADRSSVDTNRPSKRLGIFHVTNLAFKVYFKLNTVRMCQTFIANLRTGGVELDQYPISQQVTYQYYLGRYCLSQNRLRAAEKCLSFAFEKCTYLQWHNKRLILQYLIPTRLILGKFPRRELMAKYELMEYYEPLVAALKTGNYNGYLQHLEYYFDYFYNSFTYVLLRERGKVLLWRSLLRKTYLYLCTIEQKTVNTMPLQLCQRAVHFAMKSEDMDLADVECMLVSLVSQGYIKGYIHHQKKLMVLSKVNPFPRVVDVHLHTEVYDEEAINQHLAIVEGQTIMASPPIHAENEPAVIVEDTTKEGSLPRSQVRATAEREIQQWQNHTGLAIPRTHFQDLVHEITNSIDPTLRMQTAAIDILQQATEAHVVSVIRDGRMITEHEGRVEVRPKDIRLAQLLRGTPFEKS